MRKIIVITAIVVTIIIMAAHAYAMAGKPPFPREYPRGPVCIGPDGDRIHGMSYAECMQHRGKWFRRETER